MADQAPKDERTEDATPRRREEAREKGQVALSSEVLVAAMLVAAFAGLALGGGPLACSWGVMIVDSFRELPALGTDSLELVDLGALLVEAGNAALLPLGFFVSNDSHRRWHRNVAVRGGCGGMPLHREVRFPRSLDQLRSDQRVW